MTPSLPADVRQAVAERAGYACEYCGIPEVLTYFGCQIDHIIAQKHGGGSEIENLCYACVFCDRAKGSDIGSIDPTTLRFVRFFNPRVDRWADHFRKTGARIEPVSDIGAVTARILKFNASDRLLERWAAMSGE
jgi:hypothetical protein